MKKWSFYVVLVIQIILIQNNLRAQQLTLLKKTGFSHYPSSSAIEFYNTRLYVIGDDATNLLVLDVQHKILDSIKLFQTGERRLSKEAKADIESITIIRKNRNPFLLAISSFSTAERNFFLKIPMDIDVGGVETGRSKKTIKRFKKAGIKEPNIEGLAAINKDIIMSNRANKTHRDNQFIYIKAKRNKWVLKPHHIQKVQLPGTEEIIGISGLTYLPGKDLLLFTASTEDTENAYADGMIGESYLGLINEFSKKKAANNINANKLMPLTKILGGGLQKMESLCVESLKDGKAILHLAADNDNGQSTLFKIELRF